VEVAKALGLPLLEWHIKSTTKAQQGLYGTTRSAACAIRSSAIRACKTSHYIVKGMLWQAFTSETPVVLLIDEIDQGDIEFPNDLLRELDRMEFFVYETKELRQGGTAPMRLHHLEQTKKLPDAFLRRCFFHYIRFPDKETMEKSSRCTFRG